MGSRIIGHIYSHPQSNFQKPLIEYIQKNHSNARTSLNLLCITTTKSAFCGREMIRLSQKVVRNANERANIDGSNTLYRGMLLTLSAWETRELQGSRSHRRDRERCTRKK
jgi:hypothetical protein